MNVFLSKYINNIDKKGRVSVPANYRLVLNDESFNGVIAYPSFTKGCIEVCGISRINQLSKIIEKLDPYSQERDALETLILGEAIQLPFDGEGRIILSKSLLQHADVTDQVCFIGKGRIFEIWQPEKFEQYLVQAKKIAQTNRLTLRDV